MTKLPELQDNSWKSIQESPSEVKQTEGRANLDPQPPMSQHLTLGHFIWSSQQQGEVDVNIRRYFIDKEAETWRIAHVYLHGKALPRFKLSSHALKVLRL